MKIVLNLGADDTAGSRCIRGLWERLVEAGIDATLNDWDHYDRYDVAVFMGYENDVAGAKRQNTRIRVALADPKQSKTEWVQAARAADFLMVSSIEQRDVFYRLNRNILVFYMFPLMPPVEKVHKDKEPIVIGYHGNRVNLECMFGGVQLALNELSRRRSIEFWAVYNVAELGQARFGIPDSNLVRTRHIQWSPEMPPGSTVSTSLYEELARADIGIVPSAIPIRDRLRMLEEVAHPQPEFRYEPFDYLLRFKASSNPGRIYPFAQLGIPVVADSAPSFSQFIHDGESGFIASSPQGWLEALETLADSADLRNKTAHQLRLSVRKAFDRQVDEFVAFCQKPLKTAPVVIRQLPSLEDELRRLDRYRRFGARPWWRRLARLPVGLGRAIRVRTSLYEAVRRVKAAGRQ